MSVLSKFSKGIKESRALSFSRSASFNCEKTCKQIHGACYALKPEARYKDYGRKLIRHSRIKPYNLLNLARFELSHTKSLKWFRFSVSGSVPHKRSLNSVEWTKTVNTLRDVCADLISRGVKIHFPVESLNKAKAYRKALNGLPVVIRRTIQDKRGLKTFNDPCAYVADDVESAFELAKQVRNEGKTAVVCPAIEGVSKQGKSKCGACMACSSPLVSLVIYPLT